MITDYKKLIEIVLTNEKPSSFDLNQHKNNYKDDPLYK